MKRKLNLKKEILTDLTADDLRAVVGGAESESCPMTYSCVSCWCFNSLGCIHIEIPRANC